MKLQSKTNNINPNGYGLQTLNAGEIENAFNSTEEFKNFFQMYEANHITGKSNPNVLPSRTLLFTQILPPIASNKLFANGKTNS